MPTARKTVEKVTDKAAETGTAVANPVVKAAHTLLLAGLGTFVMTKEEIEHAVERLAEKGEVVEKDGRKMFDDLFERRREDMTKAEERFENIMDQRIENMLKAMNIPSKTDIESLSKEVAKLSKKVGELDKKVAVEQKAA
ncbi:MAG: phasin family protein [Caldilineales bacterium]|nr:phasin family protein [Caldilineales bacterium]